MTVSHRRSSERRGHHKPKMPTLRSALHQDDQLGADQMQESSSLAVASDQISSELLNENLMNSHSSDQVCYDVSNATSTNFDQCAYLAFPKDQDLVNVLVDEGSYESELGLLKRKELINELDILVKQWIRSVSLSKGFNWQMVELVGGKIVTYGSYKLGVVGTSGDMDILCIAPQHIDRNDFFNSLFSQLRKRSKDITELRSLPDAFVPVIKMKFKGIEVDLTFASLYCREIPEDEKFLHSAAMSQLDARCLRSLNGYRATAEILDLVPDIPSFQVALRAVKLWAKKNGIYGNILGFPGGFSWTILVAKICQMNKGAGPSELIHKFFLTWSSWPWPDPVYLRQPGPQPYLAWNPKVNPQDKTHCMPIITPSTPQINSTNLVTRSTLKCIHARLTRGLDICEDVLSGRESWNALFRTPSFFQEHEDYLLVTATCDGDQVLWFGLIESQLRHLKDNLEREYGVTAAHIWPTAFTREESIPIARMWFLAVEIHPAYDVASFQQPLQMFQDQLLTKSHSFQSNYNASMNITVHHITDQEVGTYISEKEMGVPEKKKLSYAAVTLGQTEEHDSTISVTAPPQQQEEITTTDGHTPDIGSSDTVECQPKIRSSNGQEPNTTIKSEVPAVAFMPVTSFAATSETTSFPPALTSMSPAIAAVYHATINNYHLPNANYLQPSYQQSYITHLSNNSNHLNAGHTTYQEYRRPPSPSSFASQPRGFGNNRNSTKPPFPSDQNNSSQVYKNLTTSNTYKGSLSLPNLNNKENKENTETHVLYYSNAAANLQMPIQNYLSAPPNYSQINPATPRRPTIQNLPPAPVHTNSPIPHQNQTPVNSPSVTLRNSKHNPFPSPISLLSQPNLQVPQPNTNIPPPPIHSNHLVNIQMLDRSTPPPSIPIIDRSTPPPSRPSSPLYNVRLLPPNNNHLAIGLDCSCSISDAESTTSRKDSCSDAEDKDRLRSVSNSSDKFPPSSLTRARVTHQEKEPISPLWGMIPLSERPVVPLSPLLDTSVPPPSVAPSVSGATPSFATAMLRPHRQRNSSRRLSQSEIRDTPVPRPVNTVFKQQNIRFSFNSDSARLSMSDNVFK